MQFIRSNGTTSVTAVPERLDQFRPILEMGFKFVALGETYQSRADLSQRAARVAESSFDDVIVFVLVFVSALVFIFILCSAYKIKLWYRDHHAGTVSSSDGSGQPYADDPPPYPGKLSRTNINYLPSYNSALQMSILSGGLVENTNIPGSPRTNQTTLTVPIVTDNGSRLVIPGAEELRSTTPVSQDSRQLQSITEEIMAVLPVIEISDVSSEARLPAVFTL